ncbi:MAG: lipase-like domain-containing protein [Beijerinckiaceae bacterium]
MKSKHIVAVPGLFGWGPGELGGFPYWGDALQHFDRTRFTTHWAKCGPISSFHDRACEVFAQIRGTRVDYGSAHSTAEGHAQKTSRDYTGRGFVTEPDWSAGNPVILLGHSAGAQTCLQLQQLLAQDFWGVGSDANWVEAVICVSGVLNGSTLTYMFCDEKTGRLKGASSFLIGSALKVIEEITKAARPIHDLAGVYDLYLDQWIGKTNATSEELLAFFKANSRFTDGEDNLAFDLSLQGCLKANQKFQTRNETYYFSLVTHATHEGILGLQQPDESMSLLLKSGAAQFQAMKPDFAQPPIKGWGAGDLAIGKWRENDGAVSSISQRLPFTADAHPPGSEGIFGRGPETIEKGKWYFEDIASITGERFDHLDPVVGAKLKKDSGIEAAQATLYGKLNALLQRL